MDRIELLKKTRLFVLDMDGTFYLGDNILDGSLYFMQQLEKYGKEFIFFTNNSSQSPEKYIDKLSKMDMHITRDQIMTSGDVMIRFLNTHHKGKSVYLLGTEPLIKSFKDSGIKLINDEVNKYTFDDIDKPEFKALKPDIVVVGFDKTLTYDKLTFACTFIREGSMFLSTHMDINCPVVGGFIPDSGAMCAAITLSTGIEPRYVGKPFSETADMVADATGIAKEEMAFVGDRIYTDVATGVNNGAMGVLVLSGETKKEDIPLSDIKPDAVYESIYEMGKLMNENL